MRVDKLAGGLIGKDEDDDKNDSVSDSTKENSTTSSPLSTSPQSKPTVVFDSSVTQLTSTQTEAHDEKESHSWGGQSYYVPGIENKFVAILTPSSNSISPDHDLGILHPQTCLQSARKCMNLSCSAEI